MERRSGCKLMGAQCYPLSDSPLSTCDHTWSVLLHLRHGGELVRLPLIELLMSRRGGAGKDDV